MNLAGNDRNEFRFPSVLRLYSQLLTLKNDGHPVDWIDVPRGGLTRFETGAMDSQTISLNDLQIPYHPMTSRLLQSTWAATLRRASARWFATACTQ
jgi:hypothetical protein